MSDRKTIADSKRAFNHDFPHVIPSLYRRTTDELLVELHLLSHQKHFQPDGLFAIGLGQVFDVFTRGYRPEAHVKTLFDALCRSSGFDPNALRKQAQKTLESVRGHNLEEVQGWIQQQGKGAPEALAQGLRNTGNSTFHYSRLMAVGLLSLLASAQGEESSDPERLSQIAHELSESVGFSKARVEKDLNLYKSNLEKMAQAVELTEQILESERRKREQKESAKLNTGSSDQMTQGVEACSNIS
ncbi:MAG TPA: photosystem II biogenesis protein Psp29 [Prochlorococcus sp.]|nr:photosystem II biogenesis protein Psp29 [Prochlorococcus sp.]